MKLHETLKLACPWLDTDEEVSGADVIDQIKGLYIGAMIAVDAEPTALQHDALGITGLTVGTEQQFLEAAQNAQRTYWDAMTDLETATGLEIDGENNDLSNYTVESLHETFDKA